MLWATTVLLSALVDGRRQNDTRYRVSGLVDPAVQQHLGIEDKPSERLCRMACFYWSCRYFTRAWVIQEIVQARSLKMFCGRREISLFNLMQLTEILDTIGWIEGLVALLSLDLRYIGEKFLRFVVRWDQIAPRPRNCIGS
jgi:hypothetical protein